MGTSGLTERSSSRKERWCCDEGAKERNTVTVQKVKGYAVRELGNQLKLVLMFANAVTCGPNSNEFFITLNSDIQSRRGEKEN